MHAFIVRARPVLLVMAFVAAAVTAAADERIQMAILLDTSNSMDGLIGQAKSQLWNVVNELARAVRNGKTPVLEVALIEYGNDGLPESDGYIRRVSNLTTDLDLISQELFRLATNGGSEYCGMVIDKAVDGLSWSRSNDVLKVIYIAGNEPFTQGPTSYAASAAKAAKKGIIVNTVFCGDHNDGIASFWKDGADRADGRYMSINPDETVAEIETPFDQQIVDLANQLNATYLAYGDAGQAKKERQAAQDTNAATMGQEATVQRSVAKAQSAYANGGWDLVDALKDKSIQLSSLREDQLPAEMRKMTTAQREQYVATMAARRAELQEKIKAANEKRRIFVAQEMKKLAQQNTLEQAILSSVSAQAAAKGFAVK